MWPNSLCKALCSVLIYGWKQDGQANIGFVLVWAKVGKEPMVSLFSGVGGLDLGLSEQGPQFKSVFNLPECTGWKIKCFTDLFLSSSLATAVSSMHRDFKLVMADYYMCHANFREWD